jgi:hypothetical protein
MEMLVEMVIGQFVRFPACPLCAGIVTVKVLV